MLARSVRLCLVTAVVVFVGACGSSKPLTVSKRPAYSEPASQKLVTISVLATNDIHGAIDRLAVVGAYVDALRRQRAKQGGAVILLDGGDMFQGTLESNLGEGAAVVELMNLFRYDASSVGNHEFDFGPVGPKTTPATPADDPRGALKARAKEAKFPFLAANVFDKSSGRRVNWHNVAPTRLLSTAGVKVGVIGLATVETPQTTILANVKDLEFRPLASAVKAQAAELRRAGASIIVVTAHAGGICKDFEDPNDLSSCQPGHEIFELAKALPHKAVDLIVAGHTHRGVAHIVNGIPIIEQFAHGKYFGRIDLLVGSTTKEIVDRRIFPPQEVCQGKGSCTPAERYEGEPVVVSKAARAIVDKWTERARELREQPLGVVAKSQIPRSRAHASVMGNWMADLMLTARPKGDVAITNGGGLRAEIDAGPITYGDLHAVVPFDNRYAFARLTGADLKQVVLANLEHDGGILSLAGLTAKAKCVSGKLEVELRRTNGKPVADGDSLLVVTSDFLATTGREFLGKGEVTIEDGPTIRDAIAEVLRKTGGTIDPTDTKIFDPARPRLDYPGRRPVSCTGD